MKKVILLCAATFVAACSSAKLPETGAATIYDGVWTGIANSTQPNCEDVNIEGEVRYGSFVATLKDGARQIGEVWGELDAAGRTEGSVGSSGVSVGLATLQFGEATAEGQWSAQNCSGPMTLIKAG